MERLRPAKKALVPTSQFRLMTLEKERLGLRGNVKAELKSTRPLGLQVFHHPRIKVFVGQVADLVFPTVKHEKYGKFVKALGEELVASRPSTFRRDKSVPRPLVLKAKASHDVEIGGVRHEITVEPSTGKVVIVSSSKGIFNLPFVNKFNEIKRQIRETN